MFTHTSIRQSHHIDKETEHKPVTDKMQLCRGIDGQVMYVHQQRVSYPGTPLQLFERVQGFASQKSRGSQHGPGSAADLGQLVEQMGLDQGVLSQPWSQLSVSGPDQQHHALQVRLLWL
jgi:hypothetical protein